MQRLTVCVSVSRFYYSFTLMTHSSTLLRTYKTLKQLSLETCLSLVGSTVTSKHGYMAHATDTNVTVVTASLYLETVR